MIISQYKQRALTNFNPNVPFLYPLKPFSEGTGIKKWAKMG